MAVSDSTATRKHLYQGGSSSVLYTDRRDFYVKPNVVKEAYPLITPFLTYVSNQQQIMHPPDPQFKMFQHTNPWRKQQFQVTGSATCAADDAEDTIAINISYSTGMGSAFNNSLVGKVLDVYDSTADSYTTGAPDPDNYKGQVVVTTFTSVTAIKVKNLTGTSISFTQYDFCVVVGNLYGEGTEAANPQHDELSVVWGQCGIFKNAFQLTNTLMEASLRGASDEYNRLKKLNSEFHQIHKEKSMLFAKNTIGTNLSASDTFADGARSDVNGNALRNTYGVFRALLDYGATTGDDQNIFSVAQATYKYSDFVDQTQVAFEYVQDGIQPMFAGDGFIAYWSKLEGPSGGGISAKSNWHVNISDSKKSRLGFNYRELETPFGIYQLIRTPILTKSPYNNYGFAPSRDNIFHVVYRNPVYQQNIKTDNAPDYQKNQYMSDEGMGITNLPTHKMFKLT